MRRWEYGALGGEHAPLPGWLRPHLAEPRWSMIAVLLVAVILQLLLPDSFVLRPRSAAPAIEIVLCAILLIGNPGPVHDRHPALRPLSLVLIGVLAVTNAVSTVLLIDAILTGADVTAGKILASGASIWLTNVIVYALWYWEFDRGGPAARAGARSQTPDFLFPQMADARLDPDFRPTFLDYLYVSFTNATAFSPTDTMPLSRWAKVLMMSQAVVSLVTVGLVAARAVNILGT
ncbi:DUF1345 domain-containing protein [Rhodococcus spelaei]|uniref:DUF1345 domain-containing protein n=1 Tax=Rhodococcus spelaei TaxID=2546320 RepID=A0A541BAZ9_9NOCA|nr:DUF1345 domain-containing protein [Rhodococcus spelaei]